MLPPVPPAPGPARHDGDRALLLAAVVIGIVVVRFGGFGFGGGDGDAGDGSGGLGGRGGTTELTRVIGSEKRDFFEDPAVIDRLDELGYTVTVETAGSRHIATDTDLSAYDFAFPSSAPAARSVAEQAESKGIFTPFYSPMAVAPFQPVMEELAARGVTREEGGTWGDRHAGLPGPDP